VETDAADAQLRQSPRRWRDALLFGEGDHFIRRAKSTTGWFNSTVMQVRGETQVASRPDDR